MPFDDNKHPRDLGKFSKIQGGKPGEGDPADPRDPARESIKQSIMQGAGAMDPNARDPQLIQQLGSGAVSGYHSARQAMDAMHAAGDIQALHHHGKIMQKAVKALKDGGAKPEELAKLRHGLAMLHGALTRGDRVSAHDAVTQIAHGFYHAHGEFEKASGGMGIPPISNPPSAGAMAMDKIGDKAKSGQEAESERTGKIQDENTPQSRLKKARGIIDKQFPGQFRVVPAHRFGLDDLPEKPSPEAFDEAIKKAENIKVGQWDHRYVGMDRLLPSENKEADPAFVEQIKKNPNAAPPIVVKPHGNGYNILDGHHRYAAHKAAGSKGMWAVVVKDGDYMRDVPAPVEAKGVTINFHTAPVTHGDPAQLEKFKSAMVDTLKAASQPAQPINIQIPNSVIHNKVDVSPTPVKFEATVEPAPVTIQESKPDIHVHVNPTPVTVEAKPGEVKVVLPERKPLEIEFKTDKDGKLTGAKGK
jgi:hypothetical protein